MLFIDNKYTRWYYSIIHRAAIRELPPGVYTERHHIIPKSLGGSDHQANLAILTGREHFVCHWLLTKMTSDEAQRKMSYTCKRMMAAGKKQDRYIITGRRYELLKRRMSENLKGRKFTPEWREKLKAAARRRCEAMTKEERQRRSELLAALNKSRKGIKKPKQSGEANHFYGKRLTGELNGFYGKKHSPETIEKLKQARQASKVPMTCAFCRKQVSSVNVLTRYHRQCSITATQ